MNIFWFSCGVASAVATKLSITKLRERNETLTIYNCKIKEEHPDNSRFLKECQEWFGQEIIILESPQFNNSIYEVFDHHSFIKNNYGAVCTGILKKQHRFKMQQPSDRMVFGYTAEETTRAGRFMENNFDINLWPILIENKLTHADCIAIIKNVGIEIPAMYRMGYKNNNCIGCVKGGAGYWNKIRIDFPEAFDKMAKLERKMGFKLLKNTKIIRSKKVSVPIYLTELPSDAGNYKAEPEVQCGMLCQSI